MSEHPLMTAGFKFLVIADDSPEFPGAAQYAGLRAKATGAGMVLLRVVEPPGGAYWTTVEQEMRRDAMEHAQAMTARFAAEVWAEAGIEVEVVIREGEVRPELRKLIDADPEIKVVVLAAGSARDGPGPLVSSIAKGQGLGAGRALPAIVLPAGLSRDEIRNLAGAAPPTRSGEVPIV